MSKRYKSVFKKGVSQSLENKLAEIYVNPYNKGVSYDIKSFIDGNNKFQVIAPTPGSRNYNLSSNEVTIEKNKDKNVIIENADPNGHCRLKINGKDDFEIYHSN